MIRLLVRPVQPALALALALTACTPKRELDSKASGHAANLGRVPTAPRSGASPLAHAAPAPHSDADGRLAPPLAWAVGAPASRSGMVVAVEALAAAAGVRVLEQGGNSVDAAIATTLALSVTHPNAASLGGGGFALVRPPGGPSEAFDFREVAPRGLTREKFDRMIAAGARGPSAVGVPGTVAGLALLHRRFGSKPFAELVAPAIGLARNGHLLKPWQARLLAWSFSTLARDEAARAIFGRRGKPRLAGSLLIQRNLSESLERLARLGPDDFYRGETARQLAAALGPEGPSRADLAAYRAVSRSPLSFAYRGYTLETMPPPSAGGVALAGILLGLSRAHAPGLEPRSPDAIHLFLEASRRAQAERRLAVVDPDTLSEPELARRRARWLDAAFWSEVPIDPARATPSARLHPLYGLEPGESDQTTHLSVADARGMVVSLTTTLSASFGAKIVAGPTGIVMNNAVASFGAVGENQPAPSKRTTSSMAPTFLLRGNQIAAVLGTPGGDSIPSTLAQIVRNLVDHRLSLEHAIRAPRWHHGFVPDQARYEPLPAPDLSLITTLRARGHELKPFARSIGSANCLVFQEGEIHGFADPREFGVALAASRPEAH